MPPVHVVSSWHIEAEGDYSLSIELTLPDGTVKRLGRVMRHKLVPGFAFIDVGDVAITLSQYGMYSLRLKSKQGKMVCFGQETKLMITPPHPRLPL